MDSRSIPASRPSWADKQRKAQQQQKQQKQQKQKEPQKQQRPSALHYDSDASTTIDSLKDLMAASQRGDFRHGPTREDDILFAAKHARAQMPPQFREPPSSTGSHGTITQSSIHMDDENDENSVSSFSADLPDAESTRASLHPYRQRSSGNRSHRVHKSTGRFGAESRSTHRPKTVEDVLDGVVNTSALFRTFKEWRPEDAPSVRSDGDDAADDADAGGLTQESTQMGVLDKLVAAREAREKEQKEQKEQKERENKENQGSLRTAARKPNSMRGILQATVQNESDMSIVMSAAVPEKVSQPEKVQTQMQTQTQTQTQMRPPSPRRTVSLSATTAAAAATTKKTGSVQSNSSHGSNSNKKMVSIPAMPSPVLEDDLSAPETSADSREEEKYGQRRTTLINNYLDHHDRFEALDPFDDLDHLDFDQSSHSDHFDEHPEEHNEHNEQDEHDMPEEHPDAMTNQSFVVPSKSFPLLHNLVTGTLRFTPGTFFYGMSADSKRPYQLPPGRLPEDEKKIFVDVEKIRQEVVRLQEHDEMLQNEIVQGERKYQALVERFYSMAKSSDSGLGSDQAAQDEWHGVLQDRIAELEAALAAAHAQKEEHAQAAGDASAQRDAAEARAAAAADKAKKLEAAARRKPVFSQTQTQAQTQTAAPVPAPVQKSSADAQRRIRQLEQMVAERERVIAALRDEREAAASSHREASRLHKERLARLTAEKNMVSGDHAKCAEERRALTEALASARAALREQRQQSKLARQQTQQHLREQARGREAVLRAALERQRAQMARQRAQLRSNREKGVRQLDEAFRRLRESWAAGGGGGGGGVNGREETVTMTDVLGEWKENEEEENEEEEEEDDLDDLDGLDDLVNPERLDDDGLDDDVPADDLPDLSMDENMTSAFIIPDLDFAARVETDDDEEDEPVVPSPVKKVSFETGASKSKSKTSRTSSCPHQRANCIVCRQQAGRPETADARVTVAVRRPDTVRAQTRAKIAGMDPGSALAFVMKLLDDERRHLWMQIEARRHEGMPSPVPSTRDPVTARQARRESDALWQAYVRKVEQLNRLDDVVAGQAAAGQTMTPEEVDVTITRILDEAEAGETY